MIYISNIWFSARILCLIYKKIPKADIAFNAIALPSNESAVFHGTLGWKFCLFGTSEHENKVLCLGARTGFENKQDHFLCDCFNFL